MEIGFTNPDRDLEIATIQHTIGKPIWDKILSTFPADIPANVSPSHMGETCMRFFITLENDCTDGQVLRSIKWLKDFAPIKFHKFFRDESGRFAYQGRVQEYKNMQTPDVLIFIETASKLSCEIKQVTKTVTVYESICPKTLEQELANV